MNIFDEIDNFFIKNPEPDLENYFYVLDKFNFKEAIKELHLNNDEFAYSALRIYNEILLDIEKIHKEFNSGSYLMDELSLLQEESIITNEILRTSRRPLLELKELVNVQETLMLKKEHYIVSSKKTWENQVIDVAKNFGGGALAASNPWVGVPMLVNNYLNGKKSEDLSNNQYNNLIKHIREYLDQLINVAEIFNSLNEVYYEYIEKKIVSPIVKSVTEIFERLQASGVRLNNIEFYFEDDEVVEERKYD